MPRMQSGPRRLPWRSQEDCTYSAPMLRRATAVSSRTGLDASSTTVTLAQGTDIRAHRMQATASAASPEYEKIKILIILLSIG